MSTDSQKAAFEEGCAMSLLRELGYPPAPQDAFALAAMCELRIEHGPETRLILSAGLIYVRAGAAHREQQEECARELGRFTLHRYGVPDSDWSAEYVGAALLLPRETIGPDVDELGADVAALMARHPNASEAVIRRRLDALDWLSGRAA